MKLARLVFKNLKRNLLRTVLTALGTVMLVLVVTMIWTVLYALGRFTQERSANLKAIVTDRWRVPSQMPFSYAADLERGAARKEGDVVPVDSMTWQFFIGTLDPSKVSFADTAFAFGMQPKKLPLMMDELDELPPGDPVTIAFQKVVDEAERNIQGVVVGKERLKKLNKRIGDTFELHGINYKDIVLRVTVLGEFPPGRYDDSMCVHRDYINRSLDEYESKNKTPHPMAQSTLNLVWLRVKTKEDFDKLVQQVTTSPLFTSPSVKCETASSGIASFLDAYQSLLWGVRWLLSPAILVTLALVIANAIGISVRERRTEMAVMKVLGFTPGQIMGLVLGEALLLGVLAGGLTTGLAYYFINAGGGIKFPVAFFPAFYVPPAALWWGPAIGGLTALAGSIGPALSARNVRVAEVFAKVA
jgi:putative ABC transport system permease protein